ncbi:class I SAM-dependent methyltransferase [Legionella dresdenensis]|uniref:Class I SAM-dependent methyltransferase n=1 Tax=Legionella dresdenensis TaxID=450200 RepID=A0ABV8CBT4_9GAMM
MSLIDQQNRFRALDQWYKSEAGCKVYEAINAELAYLKQLLHGDIILQLGSSGDTPFSMQFRYQHYWLASVTPEPQTTLLTNLNQLPLDRNSVDCIVAPLIWEAFPEKNPIDEIDRVLKPSGYIVFIGINPASLWGFWLRFSRKNCFGRRSKSSKSMLSVKLAMMHRGYIQCHLSNFYYIPPVSKLSWINRLAVFNQVGKMLSPMPAGFYCLVMQKHESQPTLVAPVTETLFTPAKACPQSFCRSEN